ncbi:SPOR domain-containing protein [Lysobacter koreensis]|uniref:SPOR domain-containing protein n=1 Tax=Lysobacter koreensis TaxID=266122 RepID=A0ABW2YR65_9GAMM
MEPALKQRLIGATVLVALAVIFLPMLIKGPAPESGASDVPLELPDAPKGGYETRELPLVTPGETPNGGVVGMAPAADDTTLPTVDTTTDAAVSGEAMMPAATAGGDYAVSFGSYASSADAARVVAALNASQLPGYQDTTSGTGGRTLYRVRVGPYASRAEAEAARLRAAHVRDDVGSKVVTLDADVATPAATATSSVSQPIAAAAPSVSAPVALPDSKPTIAKPAVAKPIASKPVESKPATTSKPTTPATAPVAAAKPVATPIKPAASGTGFAVQLGAFSNAAEAGKLRDRARAAGFSAFVEQVGSDKGTLSRVRIGPVASRADADQLKAQVSAKLGVSGIVRPHP